MFLLPLQTQSCRKSFFASSILLFTSFLAIIASSFLCSEFLDIFISFAPFFFFSFRPLSFFFPYSMKSKESYVFSFFSVCSYAFCIKQLFLRNGLTSSGKTNKDKSTEIFPPLLLLLKPLYIMYMRSCNAESQKRSAKV